MLLLFLLLFRNALCANIETISKIKLVNLIFRHFCVWVLFCMKSKIKIKKKPIHFKYRYTYIFFFVSFSFIHIWDNFFFLLFLSHFSCVCLSVLPFRFGLLFYNYKTILCVLNQLTEQHIAREKCVDICWCYYLSHVAQHLKKNFLRKYFFITRLWTISTHSHTSEKVEVSPIPKNK